MAISNTSQCFAGGSGARDCCAACGFGSGGLQPFIAVALIEEVELIMDVPAGPHAGSHRAVAVADLTWQLTIAGVDHTVVVAGEDLVIRGPSGEVVAAAVEFEPFSATFAGDYFGSDDDVVLTIP